MTRWYGKNPQPQNFPRSGCVAPRTIVHFDDPKIYYMTDAGLQTFEPPKPSRWKRAMETLENIVWWVGGLTAMVAFFTALTLLGTMAMIGKWVISIDLLRSIL